MHKIFLTFLIILCGFVSSCSKKEAERCDVLVSIPPYLYFVETLTGGELKAISLVPEGANPHLYEPTPKQVHRAKQSKVWIRLSESFENKIGRSLLAQNKELIIVNLANSRAISYIYEEKSSCSCGHSHESKDLHIWLSLREAKIQAKLIAEALIQAFPDRKDLIQKNLLTLQDQFSQKDLSFAEKLLPYKNDSLLVSHPAFGYFCRDYDLNQISIETEGKDPLPQKLASILELSKTTPIRTVFTQAQYNNKGAEMIAKQLQMKTHEIDPYSSDYLKNLEQIVQDIVDPSI